MDYSTILRDNLLSAIEELKKKNNISSTNYYIHVCPDVSEKELSRISSTDLYYREGFINGAYETKSFTVDEFVKAFSNWMNRDILFAQEVQRQCSEEQYVSIINDGNIEIDELVDLVVSHFGLR